MARAIRAAVELTAWWLLLVGMWISTLSSVTGIEVAVAAGAALPCAALALITRRVLEVSWRPRVRWVGWLPPLAVAVVTDSVKVLLLPWRHWTRVRRPFGAEIRRVTLPDEPPPRAAARRAVAGWALSLSPGSYVADADPDEPALVVHSVVDSTPDMTRQVRR